MRDANDAAVDASADVQANDVQANDVMADTAIDSSPDATNDAGITDSGNGG